MLRHEAFAATAHEPIPAALQAQLISAARPQPAGPGVKLVVILSALMAFGSISTDLYLSAMPAMARALHARPGGMELTISAYLVGFSLGQLLWGPIGDRHGRRGPLAFGLALFVLGTTGCALAGTVDQMICWRVVQAVGASAGPVLARAMVGDIYRRERAAQVLSTLMTVMAVAPLVGPALGAQIQAVWSWEGIFWTVALLGIVTLASLTTLNETLPRDRRERRPLLDAFRGYASLLADSRVIGYAAAGGCFYGGIFAYIAGTPHAYIEFYGVPPKAYGLLFALGIVGIMITNIVNARLVTRVGSDRLLRIGTVGAAVAGIVTALDATFGWGGLPGLVAPLLAYLAAAGFIVANSVAGALSTFPPRAGAVSALVGAMQYGTGVLGAALTGWLANGTPGPMGWVIAGSGVCGAAVTLCLVRKARHVEASPNEVTGARPLAASNAINPTRRPPLD